MIWVSFIVLIRFSFSFGFSNAAAAAATPPPLFSSSAEEAVEDGCILKELTGNKKYNAIGTSLVGAECVRLGAGESEPWRSDSPGWGKVLGNHPNVKPCEEEQLPQDILTWGELDAPSQYGGKH
ncbi:hypothetical protein A0H81_13889 [Grifola frondosa]|uniref:Secreted protein n=1 Tax=Grifola frondosa TaxID=5627 RepID=A0A1C7LQG8_GRIFR|nr:hypothetical protein A0H81_13889 [Grifola frondosa]